MRIAILSIALSLGASASLLAAQPEVLIDTDFSQSDPSRTILTMKDAEIPLKVPSAAAIEKDSETSITIGKEAMGDLKPPYALFKVGSRATSVEAAGTALIRWNLIPLALDSGIFELTARLTPLDDNINGGRLIVSLTGKGGVPLKLEDKPLHPTTLPLQVSFMNTSLRVGNKMQPFASGDTYSIKIRFDLAKRIWSAWVDDVEVLNDTPFPPQLADSSLDIYASDVSFGSAAGLGDKPETNYAISNLKLIRVSDGN